MPTMKSNIIKLLIIFTFFTESIGPGHLPPVIYAKEYALRPMAEGVSRGTKEEKSSPEPGKTGPTTSGIQVGPGCLDGLAILRISIAYDSSIGLGLHLQWLNRILLERNNMTIIQMHLTEDKKKLKITTEKIGKGKLVKVPVLVKKRYKYNKVQRKIQQKARGVFSQYNVNLVMAHSPVLFEQGLVLAEEAKKREIPFLIQCHNDNNLLNNFNLEELTSMVDGIASVTGVGIPAHIQPEFEVENLLNGIDLDALFNPDNAKPVDFVYLDPDTPVILLPARLDPAKGHRDLLCAASILKKKGINCTVVFAGEEDYPGFEEELTSFVRTIGLEGNVIFTGHLPQEKLRDLYARSDVVALPTRFIEGLPRVLIEAQAMKVPVITYEVGGTSEAIIDGETGYLIKKGAKVEMIKELAKRLKELLLDKDKRVSIGRAGRRLAEEKFSLPALVERHERFYLKALGREAEAISLKAKLETAISSYREGITEVRSELYKKMSPPIEGERELSDENFDFDFVLEDIETAAKHRRLTYQHFSELCDMAEKRGVRYEDLRPNTRNIFDNYFYAYLNVRYKLMRTLEEMGIPVQDTFDIIDKNEDKDTAELARIILGAIFVQPSVSSPRSQKEIKPSHQLLKQDITQIAIDSAA